MRTVVHTWLALGLLSLFHGCVGSEDLDVGNSHGLDDFYDWEPAGWKSWVMLAGSANVVTETDGWMVRDVWRHVRSKHGYPGP